MNQGTARKVQLSPLQDNGLLPIYGLRKEIQSLIEERAKHDTHRDFCLCSVLAISAVCLSQITIDSGDYKSYDLPDRSNFIDIGSISQKPPPMQVSFGTRRSLCICTLPMRRCPSSVRMNLGSIRIEFCLVE